MVLSTIRWLALAAIILGPTCAMAQTSRLADGHIQLRNC